jgi:hypothetical protein
MTSSRNTCSLTSEVHDQPWAFDKTEKKFLLVAMAVFLLFYLPFFFGGDHTYIRVHDNLDSEAVYDAVLGAFYLHPAAARHMLLGGIEPPYLLERLTFPLSLVNVISNRFLAYALNDLIVRLTAMIGMFCLAYRTSEDRIVSLLAGLLFSLSLSLPVLGLSIAGDPAVVYLVQNAAAGRATRKQYLLLLLLGWNSSLVKGGIFLVLLLPLIRRILFGKATHNWLTACASYGFGLILGSAGLLYAIFSRMPLNRDTFAISGIGLTETVRVFFYNQFSPGIWEFYHVSAPLVFVYVAILAALVVTRNAKIGALTLLIVLINLFYCVVHFDPIAQLRIHIGGLIKTFQFDRFFFLDSFLIISTWVVAMRVASSWLRRVLIIALSVQLVWTFALATHIHSPVTGLLGRPILPSFNEYYKQTDYREIRNVIGDADTISIGLDPMAALMSDISTLDGYFNAYPLAYKARFRAVIAKQLKVSHQEDYFDSFGGRIYTFADSPHDLSLDYCAAYGLGARYLISRFEIIDPHLKLVEVTQPHHLWLYSVVACQ